MTRELVAFRHRVNTYDQDRTIYLDGRAHPSPYAPHTWMGFSTGTWEREKLTVTTTHLKKGWHRRNGVPMSDQATLTEHFVRNGDVLTRISIVTDPVYLTEPLVKSEDYVLHREDLGTRAWMFNCKAVVEVDRPEGVVPQFQLGENPFLDDYRKRFQLPAAGIRGGADTLYPEFVGRTGTATASTMAPSAAAPRPVAGDTVEVLEIQGHVYLLATGGGNTVVQVGDHGVLVVDTQVAGLSDKIVAAIRTLSDQPIHYIINTQSDADHTGGNATLAKLGPTRAGRVPLADGVGGNNTGTTSIIAHENVLNRMSGQVAGETARPEGAWPTDTFFGASTEVFFNGEGVQVVHQPAAHTDGDSIVFFRRSDVIVAGDVFLTTGYPVVDRARGGSINGVIAALNQIIRLAIPTHNQEGGTMIVPGHGRLCDEMDVVEYRNMVTIVRDRIQHLIDKGLTLDQVKAAGPTADFDPRYGAAPGGWTPTMFIEAVYRDLSAARGKS